MKVHYLGIFKNESRAEGTAAELCAEKELSSYNYFTKKEVGKFMTLFAGTVAEKTAPGSSLVVTENDYVFYSYGAVEGVCGIVITDQEYPDMTAKGLVHKITGEFTSKYPRSAFNPITKESVRENPNPLPLPELKNYLTKYQDPQQADSIVKIQKELDETKTVVYKSIESILERGEKIDNLVAKSGDLSAQSKMFYTQAKKQNSCCIVM